MLENYTTYKTYYRLVKAIADDPQVSKSKAAKALALLIDAKPQPAADRLTTLAFSSDLAQSANLEDVRIVPAFLQR